MFISRGDTLNLRPVIGLQFRWKPFRKFDFDNAEPQIFWAPAPQEDRIASKILQMEKFEFCFLDQICIQLIFDASFRIFATVFKQLNECAMVLLNCQFFFKFLRSRSYFIELILLKNLMIVQNPKNLKFELQT